MLSKRDVILIRVKSDFDSNLILAICTEDELKSRMWTMAQAVMAGIQVRT